MAGAFLEVRRASGLEVAALEAERCTIGKMPDSDVALPEDPAVSRLHAVIESYGESWAIRDVGSRNGTYVNGDRILGEHALRHGDELRVGSTTLVFRMAQPPAQESVTASAEPPPELTRREREVLVALCRPVFSGAMFTRPASIKEIAGELFVTENAVKQHLGRLYDKFAIYDTGDPRPLQLANEAIRRGAVSLADLKSDDHQ